MLIDANNIKLFCLYFEDAKFPLSSLTGSTVNKSGLSLSQERKNNTTSRVTVKKRNNNATSRVSVKSKSEKTRMSKTISMSCISDFSQ